MESSSIAMVRCRVVLSLLVFIASTYFGCILLSNSSRLPQVEMVSDDGIMCPHQEAVTCAEAILELDEPDWNDTLRTKFNCSVVEHTQTSAKACIKQRQVSANRTRFVFIGDSRVRQLYGQLVSLFDPSHNVTVMAGKHEDLFFRHRTLNLTIQFYWAAYVDLDMSVALQQELRSALNGSPASFLVVSSAVWTLRYRNASLSAFAEYQKNFTSLVPLMDYLGQRTSMIWMLQDGVEEANLAPRRRMITDNWLQLYNEAAENILCRHNATNIQVWRSAQSLGTGTATSPHSNLADSLDGLHASPRLVRAQVNLLLNHHCSLP